MIMLLSDEHERASMARECSLYPVGVARAKKVTGGRLYSGRAIKARRIQQARAASNRLSTASAADRAPLQISVGGLTMGNDAEDKQLQSGEDGGAEESFCGR
jgi:hypothetical protein